MIWSGTRLLFYLCTIGVCVFVGRSHVVGGMTCLHFGNARDWKSAISQEGSMNLNYYLTKREKSAISVSLSITDASEAVIMLRWNQIGLAQSNAKSAS